MIRPAGRGPGSRRTTGTESPGSILSLWLPLSFRAMLSSHPVGGNRIGQAEESHGAVPR